MAVNIGLGAYADLRTGLHLRAAGLPDDGAMVLATVSVGLQCNLGSTLSLGIETGYLWASQVEV